MEETEESIHVLSIF